MSTVAAPDLVVDACLVVKWYIPEVHSTEAQRFLPPAFTLHVPDLFYAELGNILRNKAVVKRPYEITIEEGRRILHEVLRLPLMSYPMAPLLAAAYDLAVAPAPQTVYDSIYLTLARSIGCRMATADRAFYEGMVARGDGADLIWVADPF
jgi:predicted nucleic acid-binding protein